jgi:hypothetical protein
MNHFEITGWELPTLAEASEKAALLLEKLAASPGVFAVEAHCHDHETLRRVANNAPSGRCTCYCWLPIVDGREFKVEHFAGLRSVRVVSKNTVIAINETVDLPPYEWDGKPSNCSSISLTIFHPAPLKPEEKRPSEEIVELLSKLGAEEAGQRFSSVKTSSSWQESGREHSYLFSVLQSKASTLLSEIWSRLELLDGVGSFEFVGSPDQLAGIYSSSGFRFEQFPAKCWNLNYPADTVFSYGTSVFLVPTPNVNLGQLRSVAAIIDKLEGQVKFRSVVKKYISWKLAEGGFSRNVQGNYLLVSQRKLGDYVIYVGFERYEDKDPATRKFTTFASSVLGGMGLQMKKVSGPQ